MIRQARSYLVSAVSGTTLVVVAVIVFIALVSLQTLRDWPLPGLVGGSEAEVDSAVGTGPPLSAPALRTSSGTATVESSGAGDTRNRGDGNVGGVPVTGPVAQNGGGGIPAPDAPVSRQTARNDGAGNGRSAVTVGVGGGPGRQPPGGGDGSGQAGGVGGETVSETVAGAVDDTLGSVDRVTAGVLGETGVTETTEEVVDDVAGPDSTAGKTVDDAVGKVKGAVDGVAGE